MSKLLDVLASPFRSRHRSESASSTSKSSSPCTPPTQHPPQHKVSMFSPRTHGTDEGTESTMSSTGAFFTDLVNHAKRKLGGTQSPDKGQLGVAPAHHGKGQHHKKHGTAVAGLVDAVTSAPGKVMRVVEPGTAVAGLTGWLMGGAVGAAIIGGGYWLYKKHQQAAICPTDNQMLKIFSDLDRGAMTVAQGTALATSLDRGGCHAQSAAIFAAIKVKTGGPPIKKKLGGVEDPKFFVINPMCVGEVNGLPDDPRPNPLGPIFGPPLPGLRTTVMDAIEGKDPAALRKIADTLGVTKLADCLRGYAEMLEKKADVTLFTPVLPPDPLGTVSAGFADDAERRKRTPPWLGGTGEAPCRTCPIERQPDFVASTEAERDAQGQAMVHPMFRRPN